MQTVEKLSREESMTVEVYLCGDSGCYEVQQFNAWTSTCWFVHAASGLHGVNFKG